MIVTGTIGQEADHQRDHLSRENGRDRNRTISDNRRQTLRCVETRARIDRSWLSRRNTVSSARREPPPSTSSLLAIFTTLPGCTEPLASSPEPLASNPEPLGSSNPEPVASSNAHAVPHSWAAQNL